MIYLLVALLIAYVAVLLRVRSIRREYRMRDPAPQEEWHLPDSALWTDLDWEE